MKKWLKYIGFAILGFVILGIIAVASDDSKAEGKESTAQPVVIPYTIVSKDASSRQLTYRLTIDERADKSSLIEIARKLKEETGWKDELVCFFDIKAYSHSNAWASCSYLPRCEECKTDKDKEGDPVRFELIGVSRSLADTLQKFTLDTIENKQLVFSYIEDAWRCKTQLYKVNNDVSKLLMAQLFMDGRYLLKWLDRKQVNGQARYYFPIDPDDEDINYILVDTQSKVINYLDREDKIWQSYAVQFE
jgi:hypothetical protein